MLTALVTFMPEIKIFFVSLGIYMGGLIVAAIINPRGGGMSRVDVVDRDTGRTYRMYEV